SSFQSGQLGLRLLPLGRVGGGLDPSRANRLLQGARCLLLAAIAVQDRLVGLGQLVGVFAHLLVDEVEGLSALALLSRRSFSNVDFGELLGAPVGKLGVLVVVRNADQAGPWVVQADAPL